MRSILLKFVRFAVHIRELADALYITPIRAVKIINVQ